MNQPRSTTGYFPSNAIYDEVNRLIFDLIGADQRVLDVECETGRLVEKLRTEKNCYVVCVVVNELMASEAKDIATSCRLSYG